MLIPQLSGIPLPLLTRADPGYSREGGLDPLGLYAVADSLAVRLVPGVRERMIDPRYLTAMTVGLAVCEGFEPDELAADGRSEPAQVFEWYVVEGLVRVHSESREIQGLPGIEKGRMAVRNRIPLSAANYLKAAHVFGFYGVYRRLGEALQLYDDSGLLEEGWALVSAWEQDRGLEGFHTDHGKAASSRRSLHEAVHDGLRRGATDRSAGWTGWGFIGEHLTPRRQGAHEIRFLQRLIKGTPGSSGYELVKFLLSEQGQLLWREAEQSERAVHLALRPGIPDEIGMLLAAILAYERFARLIQDAFDECLFELTRAYGRRHPRDLARAFPVTRAVEAIDLAYKSAVEALTPIGEQGRFEQDFSSLITANDAASWVASLLDHHVRNQARKPPSGKNSWFDHFDDGSVAVRAGYTRENGARGDDEYVHYYRSRPLLSFATHLGMIES